jgi:hypothetical protein
MTEAAPWPQWGSKSWLQAAFQAALEFVHFRAAVSVVGPAIRRSNPNTVHLTILIRSAIFK